MTKLIFGCGYLGHRVAKLWQATGETVCVVTRSVDRAAQLRDEGFETVVADVTNADTLTDLPPAETVLFAVGFDRIAGNTIYEVYTDGVKNVLAAPALFDRAIYLRQHHRRLWPGRRRLGRRKHAAQPATRRRQGVARC